MSPLDGSVVFICFVPGFLENQYDIAINICPRHSCCFDTTLMFVATHLL